MEIEWKMDSPPLKEMIIFWVIHLYILFVFLSIMLGAGPLGVGLGAGGWSTGSWSGEPKRSTLIYTTNV